MILTEMLCALTWCELSSGPDVSAGADSGTAPPGGHSAPPPGAGRGDVPSEGQSAAGGARPGGPGAGPPPEGQMPGGAGIFIPTVANFGKVFLLSSSLKSLSPNPFFLFYFPLLSPPH